MSVASNSNVPLNGLTPTANAFDPATNRLVGTRFAYNGRGDVTTLGAMTMAYDAERHEIHSTDSGTGQTIDYLFDALEQRVQKQVSSNGVQGPTTVYVHDALGNLADEYSSAGVTPSCMTCYLPYDGLGSVRLITDQNANVVARHDLLPYGEEIPSGYAGRSGNGFGNGTNVTQTFTGQERDGGTAVLDFFNAAFQRGAGAVLSAGSV